MNSKTILHGLRAAALALLAGLIVSAPTPVYAAGHGSSGGGHIGGGAAAAHGGYGGRYGGAYRGGYYGGRYGYGWRGGYWGGGWGWWGWPGALFLATLPFYYSTLWWDGVPYYYAYDNYYMWSNSANGYVSVTPPPQIANQAAQGGLPYPAAAPGGGDLFVYPKNGQSAEQIAHDRQDCQAWATSQAGAGGSDHLRAQTACLEARGYSVR
ncbi:MAG TPA: hypothetical protein VGP20_08550 [Steroidobacteraceae bacterium]|jgi:hypothetical protein|nr:hypothetical protein [Steroidobacteraceae bacterium]